MIEVISKNKAKHNGKVVSLKKASLKTYRGGQLFIRFYLTMSGNMGAEVYRVNGRPFKNRSDRKNSDWGDRIPRKINTVYMGKSRFDGLRNREYYTSDLGLTSDYNNLYHFSNDTWNLLNELSDNKDRKTGLLLTRGITIEEANKQVKEMARNHEWDKMMDKFYHEDQ